jgi:putative peptidoglycan lipid II flippase
VTDPAESAHDESAGDGPAPAAAAAPGGGLLRSSAVVGLGTALSRVTGFGRVAAVAYALGATEVSGVYAYANETPNILYELLLGGILTAMALPLFVRHFQERDEEATNAVVTIATVALVGATLVGILLAPWVVRLYTLQVDGPTAAAQRDLATSWLRLFMPQILFYGLTALAAGLLNARRRFAAAAFAPIGNNLVVIAIFLALPRLVSGPVTVERVLDDPALLVWIGLGTTAGIATMALALWPAIARAGIRLRPVFAWRHPAVRTMTRLSGWTVGYVVANQIALWVVLVLANGTTSGAFVYLSAYAFFQLPHGLFAVSITTALQPELAAAFVDRDLPALRARFGRGLRLILTLMIPAAALYVGLTQPIVTALLQRGAFDAAATVRVADTLLAFAVGLPFFSSYLYVQRAFYAMQDTQTPFLLNCFENAVNIVLALVLFGALGIPGLALSFSLAYAAAAGVSLVALHRRLGGGVGGLGSAVARLLLVGAAVSGATWAVARAVGSGTAATAVLACAAAGTTGALVAGAGIRVLGLDEGLGLDRLRRRRAGRSGPVSP